MDQPAQPVWFGVSVEPSVQQVPKLLGLARRADDLGLDLMAIQDHPYNPTFLDTWTLLAAIGPVTRYIRLLPNVLNLPLRPPAMVAKAAATLDLLTGGRVELGLGAGAFWEGITGLGGPTRTPGEAVDALAEAIRVLRALWQPASRGQTVNMPGNFYALQGAQPGPPPAHPIRIWLGVRGQRMLRLTGAQADGWIISATYTPPARVPALQAIIDTAAREAGRPPSAVRRAYNLGGLILPPGQTSVRAARPGVLVGQPSEWIDAITGYVHDLRMDTFIFWPVGDDKAEQFRRFGEEVVPGVRAALEGMTE